MLNPASGDGRAGRVWRRLEPRARELLGRIEVHRSEGPGALTRLAGDLARQGGPCLVIAAGGDGTTHEVINGLAPGGQPLNSDCVLGLLPIGSGNDFARSVGVPRNPVRAVHALAHNQTLGVDLGLIQCRDPTGAPSARCFGSSVTFGLSAAALELVARTGKPLGGRVSYLIAAIRAILSSEPARGTIEVDGGSVHEGDFLLLSLTNGPFFGAGMQIAPGASATDGRLDQVLVRAMSRREALLLLPRVYRGRHLRHPAVQRSTATRVGVECGEGEVAFESDGELLRGRGPFEITVCPGALTVAVGR